MAIHAKKLNINGTSNMVSFTDSVTDSDLQLVDSNGLIYNPSFRTIEAVHNFSGAPVAFGGYSFAAGVWKFGDVGGLKLAVPETGAITGAANCLITLRT